MSINNFQFTNSGKLKHLVSIEGLNKKILETILDNSDKTLLDYQNNRANILPSLLGKTVINMFFENSTRTRTTFEIAAQSLCAKVINFDVANSSTSKGESLLDTLRTVEAMGADIFVIRHQDSGAANFIAKSVDSKVSIVNAGDGSNEHPTQAILDILTIKKNKAKLDNLSIAIVGDIARSRVARSEIKALKLLGVKDIRLAAPPTMLPNPLDSLGVSTTTNINHAIDGADVIIMLRIQKERLEQESLISCEKSYFKNYGLTSKRLQLAHPQAIVMHPGPINRNIEISSDVADSKQSVILQQVSFGLAVRMSVFSMLAGSQEQK